MLATIADLPFHAMGRFPKDRLIGRCRNGGIDFLSSKEFFERVRDVSLGLTALGIGAGDRVVLLAESRPEWLIADLAILTAGGVTVPIYSTLPAQQARYILNDAGARAAIVSTRDAAREDSESPPPAAGPCRRCPHRRLDRAGQSVGRVVRSGGGTRPRADDGGVGHRPRVS